MPRRLLAAGTSFLSDVLTDVDLAGEPAMWQCCPDLRTWSYHALKVHRGRNGRLRARSAHTSRLPRIGHVATLGAHRTHEAALKAPPKGVHLGHTCILPTSEGDARKERCPVFVKLELV